MTITCDLCPAPAEVRYWASAWPLGQADDLRCYEHRIHEGSLGRRRTYMGSNLGARFDTAMFTSDLITPPADMMAVGICWGGQPIEVRIPLAEATPARIAYEVQSLRKRATWTHEAHRGQLVDRSSLSVKIGTAFCGYGSFAPGQSYAPGPVRYVPKPGVLISLAEDALRLWAAVRRMHDLNNRPLPIPA